MTLKFTEGCKTITYIVYLLKIKILHYEKNITIICYAA